MDCFIPEEPNNAKQNCEQKDEVKNFAGTSSSSGRFYRGARYGLSLNEVLLGPSKTDSKLEANFPNFDLLDNNDEPDIQNAYAKGFVNCREYIHNEEFFPLQAASISRGVFANKQTIFPINLEHNFYSYLINNISKITYR